MLGVCAIDLDDLNQQGNVQKWYELYCDKQPAGEILIEASVSLDNLDFEMREKSPERVSHRATIFGEGTTASHGSAYKESFTKNEEHIVGHNPFAKKLFETPVSTGFETVTSSGLTFSGSNQFSERQTAEFNTMSYQTRTEGNYGGISSATQDITVERNLESMTKSIDEILARSRMMAEEIKLRESKLHYPNTLEELQRQDVILREKASYSSQNAQEYQRQDLILTEKSAYPQVETLQDFQRQDSIPSEKAGSEGIPLFPETHAGPIHASHFKFGEDTYAGLRVAGDDSNAMSKAAEFRVKVLERVERSKNMLKQRISTMKENEEANLELGQPSMKYKVLTGLEKAMTKRQYPQSERKAARRTIEEEEIQITASHGSTLKEKVLEKAEHITHSSIRTLRKLENKLREKRGEEIELEEEREEVQRHSKSAKKESLRDKVEYIKDVSREKVLAKLRKPGVDEGIQTEDRYLEEEKTGAMETIKKKATDLKDAVVEKVEEVTHKKSHSKKKKSKKSRSSSSSSSSSEDGKKKEETLTQKAKGKIERGVKKVALKMAEKKVEKAEEGEKKEALHKKYCTFENEEEGVMDKVKEKIGAGAKHVAIKAAKNKVEKAEENLEDQEYQESGSHKKSKNKKKHDIREVEHKSTSNEKAKKSHKGVIETVKEGITEEVEKVKQKLASTKEQIAQYGSRETEEHATAQQAYNEYERSAERTYEYQEMNTGRAWELNNELILGMKDLTETLDRLQKRIEEQVDVQQNYSQYGQYGSSTYDLGLIQERQYSTEAPGVIAEIKEKVKGGVEKLESFVKAKEEGSDVDQSRSIASLMDQLSKDIQDSNIDDKIYMTKEYKRSLEDEKQHKMEHREQRMRTLKLKVKEGFQNIKEKAHVTQHETEAPSGPIAELMDQFSEEMAKKESVTEFEAEHQQTGIVETVKEKVMEGVEQVKNMVNLGKEEQQPQEIFESVEVPDVMIPLQDDKPIEGESIIHEVEEIKTVKPHTDTLSAHNMFHFDYATGLVETIKEKIHDGIEKVKELVQHKRPVEELSAEEAFQPHHQLRRSPEGSPRVAEARQAESLYVTDDNELEVRQGDLLQSAMTFGGGSTANFTNFANFEFEENREFESRQVENVVYEATYVQEGEIVSEQQKEFEKEMDLFEQQMLGNVPTEKNPFDAAYEDFTKTANQTNW